MIKIKIIVFVFPVLFVLNSSHIKAQDSIPTAPKHIKKFYHDLHLGILEIKFNEKNWGTLWWKNYVLSYSCKYINKNISASIYMGINAPNVNLDDFHSALYDEINRITWSFECGFKELYFFKINRMPSVALVIINTPFWYTAGYVYERNYSIQDYELFYSPKILTGKNMKAKLGAGLSYCNGYKKYIVSPGWHGNGWYEPIRGYDSINETGFIFEAEYYARFWKHISFRAFANYRTYKEIVPLFSYVVSGGVSF